MDGCCSGEPNIVVFLLQDEDDDVRICASIKKLRHGSSAFSSMLSHPWLSYYTRDTPINPDAIVVPIHDADPVGFANVVNFLEADRLHLSSIEEALETLCISTRFLVISASVLCIEYLAAHLTRGNVLHVFDVLVRYCPMDASSVTSGSSTPTNAARLISKQQEISSTECWRSPTVLVDSRITGLDSSEEKLNSLVASSEALAASCLLLIAADAESQLRDGYWVELSADAVHMILSMDTLNVSSEKAVLEAVLQWASHRCQVRTAETLRQAIPAQILFSVRLFSLTAVEFVALASKVLFSPEESSFVLASIALAGQAKAYYCASNFGYENDDEGAVSSLMTNDVISSSSFSPPSTILPYLHVLSRGRAVSSAVRRKQLTMMAGSRNRRGQKIKRKPSSTKSAGGSADGTDGVKTIRDECCSIWSCWLLCFGCTTSAAAKGSTADGDVYNPDVNKMASSCADTVRGDGALDARGEAIRSDAGTAIISSENGRNGCMLATLTSIAAWFFG